MYFKLASIHISVISFETNFKLVIQILIGRFQNASVLYKADNSSKIRSFFVLLQVSINFQVLSN